MFISLFPNWTGQTQPRVVKIEEDNLYLSTASRLQSGGTTVMSYLHWKRAKKNRGSASVDNGDMDSHLVEGSPPPDRISGRQVDLEAQR